MKFFKKFLVESIEIVYSEDGYGVGVVMIVKNLSFRLDEFGIGLEDSLYCVFVYIDLVGESFWFDERELEC